MAGTVLNVSKYAVAFGKKINSSFRVDARERDIYILRTVPLNGTYIQRTMPLGGTMPCLVVIQEYDGSCMPLIINAPHYSNRFMASMKQQNNKKNQPRWMSIQGGGWDLSKGRKGQIKNKILG
jgi:hypothetical protein